MAGAGNHQCKFAQPMRFVALHRGPTIFPPNRKNWYSLSARACALAFADGLRSLASRSPAANMICCERCERLGGPRLGLATSRLDNRVHLVLPLCFTTRPTHSFDLACGA